MKAIELSKENIEIILNVHSFFNDVRKTRLWLMTPNLNFGGSSPIQLMYSGRSKKLLKTIITMLDGNQRI